jgi:glycosyltransferase involved in cell wall biosynthesis
MTSRNAALAIPGDLNTLTGGYLYDRRLLSELRATGRQVTHIALPGSFPAPSAKDKLAAAERLAAMPQECPVIIDGLAMGAMDTALLAGMAAPIVALVHHPLARESGLEPERRAALFRSERANLALAAHVIVTSRHTAALLTAEYGVPCGRLTVARPGMDAPPAAVEKTDPPLILSVGMLAPRKGHDVLLRALASIAERPWQAIIVGSPRDAAHADLLTDLASDSRLSGRLHMVNEVPANELARLYGQATVFALATRYEGHGIVFDEAMTHGLPVVSCATGAVPDTLADGAGILVPPDDPGAFAAALARVLDDAEARSAMAAASAAAGAALPGWDVTAQQVSRVLDAVVARA